MPSEKPTPTVSRVFDDGTILELLYDEAAGTTSFALCRADGSVSVETSFTAPSGERLTPYSPSNNLIATECVLLPSDIGDFRDKGDLLERIRMFLARYVDLTPVFADIASHYVLLTWVYDAFSDLPYLRFRGDFGTGKTRALLTVGSLCYKPFFASGASTVSPIFHVLDVFGGTLILDEADFRFSDATAELTKILNNGNMRGLPVLRTMTNRHNELNPRAFRVFGPKVVAMRENFADRALESRFLTEETGGRPLPPDIPIHLPASLKEEARELRNKLLSWRFRSRSLVGPNAARLLEGVSARANQTALALLSLVDDPELRDRIRTAILGEENAHRAERATSFEGYMLSALQDAFSAELAYGVKVSAVAERFNKLASRELGRVASNKWVGAFLRTRLRLRTIKTSGVYAVPIDERPRVAALAERFGVLNSFPTSPST
jgi:hypothetical protein